MKLDESILAFLFVVIIIIFLFGAITYDNQQKRVVFQQAYNKNLECRQALKDLATGRINDICGTSPVIGDFVK